MNVRERCGDEGVVHALPVRGEGGIEKDRCECKPHEGEHGVPRFHMQHLPTCERQRRDCGGGKGEDIVYLAKRIQNSVEEKFGIRISPEVNFV